MSLLELEDEHGGETKSNKIQKEKQKKVITKQNVLGGWGGWVLQIKISP